eukprot:404781-Pyramimonas_sp.AAC.1
MAFTCSRYSKMYFASCKDGVVSAPRQCGASPHRARQGGRPSGYAFPSTRALSTPRAAALHGQLHK